MATSAAGGRRFLICVGVERYAHLRAGEQISHCMTDHPSRISAVRCAADGPHLLCATGSQDGLARVWSITEERLLAEISLATAVNDLALTADRRLLVATGSGLATFQIHR
jgi:hypothetical protein